MRGIGSANPPRADMEWAAPRAAIAKRRPEPADLLQIAEPLTRGAVRSTRRAPASTAVGTADPMPSPPAPPARAEASSGLTGCDGLRRRAEACSAPGRGLGLPHRRAGDEDRGGRGQRNKKSSHRMLLGSGPVAPCSTARVSSRATTFKAQSVASGAIRAAGLVDASRAPAVSGDACADRARFGSQRHFG